MGKKEDVKFTQDTIVVQTIIEKALSQHATEKSLNINVFNLQVSNYEAAEPPLQIEAEPEPLKIEQEKEKDITLTEYIQLTLKKDVSLIEFLKRMKKIYVLEALGQAETITDAAVKLKVTRPYMSKLKRDLGIDTEL